MIKFVGHLETRSDYNLIWIKFNLPNFTSKPVDVITCLVLLSKITGGILTNSQTSAFTLLLKPATIWGK